MKIIDAHLHLFRSPSGDEEAQSVGHVNSTDHLRQVYGEMGIVHGVVMGNHSLALDYHDYPGDLFHYCLGLDSSLTGGAEIPNLADIVEAHLRRKSCCGVKLYPGYSRISLSDPLYGPVYELAAEYHKPVAVHMGLTAFPGAQLKYCHPLALDEVAAKNPNVSADLSGLLEGRTDLDAWFREQAGYAALLRTWLAAVGNWEKYLFGTDWPIVNLGEYIEFIRRIVPASHWEAVFFDNANRVYGLGL